MKTFNVTNLPFKHFSDFAMSSDGKCLTVVSHLSKFATADQYLKQFYINNSPYLFAYSGIIDGSMDRRSHIKNMALQLSSSIYSGNWFADGSIFSSWNYGNTWHLQTGLKPRNWVSCDMSSDGKIQAIVGRGIYKDFFDDKHIIENTPTHVYISYDSGRSWEPKCSSRTWNAVTISPNGNSLLASDTYLYNGPKRKFFHFNDRPQFENNIFRSKNSGHAWELAYTAPIQSYYLKSSYSNYSSINFGEDGLPGSLYNDFSYFGKKQAKLSSDGTYQLIASKNGVIINSGNGAYNSTTINPSFIHSIPGLVGTAGDDLTGRLYSKFLPVACDMSDNGKYQIIVGQGFIGQSGYDSIGNYSDLRKHSSYFANGEYGSYFNPDLYYSQDYGKSWKYFKGLESGMYGLSVSISNDFKYIDILAVPNTKMQKDRFGSVYTHADLFNFTKQFYNTNSDLIHLSSEDSGVTWEKRDIKSSSSPSLSGMFSAPNSIINQFPLGVSEIPETYSDNFFSFEDNYKKYIFYNYPELEYLNININFTNVFNSKVITSNDGTKTAILHNGSLSLSSSFPINQPVSIPIKDEILFPSTSFENWSIKKSGERFVQDAFINGDGQYITYIVNSGNLSSNQSNLDSSFYSLPFISGYISGKLHGIHSENLNKDSCFKGGSIFSSQNYGSTWGKYNSPWFSGSFDYEMRNYNDTKSFSTGYFKNNLSKVCISDNGQYQIVFSDSIIPSGKEIITTEDLSLDLNKQTFVTPYFYSTNFGSTWTTKYLETTFKGLNPSDLYISNDGNTIYFLGENTGTVYFQNIRTDQKRERPDLQYISEDKILPFATNYYKKTTSYSISKYPLPGKALYYSNNAGSVWSKISLIESIYHSGDTASQYSLNSNLVTAINNFVPVEYQITQKIDSDKLPFVNMLSFCPSLWSASSPFRGANCLISIEGAVSDFSSIGIDGIEYPVKNPYSRGIIKWNNISNSFSYSSSIEEDHGVINPGLYYTSGITSLNFKSIKIAKSSPNIVAALCEAKYYYSHSDGILGNKINNISNKDLSNLFLSYNSGISWQCSSQIGYLEDLNISNDGKCISYLSKVEDSLIFLDEGRRFGVPYVSKDYGNNFYPVLKWEGDIESRRCAFVSNEFLSDKGSLFSSSDNISGRSESNIFDSSYNVYGTNYDIGSGYIDLNQFYYTGVQSWSLSQIFASGLLGKSSDCKNYAFISDPGFFTMGHLNNNLSCFRMNYDGSKQLIVENASNYTEQNLFNGNTKEKYLKVASDAEELILNSKLYYNNVSGFYYENNNTYITGSGTSILDPNISTTKAPILFGVDSGKSAIPYPKYNTSFDRRGNNYFGDKIQPYTFFSGSKGKLFSIRNNQILFGVTGEKLSVSKETSIISNETESSILYSGYNLYTTDDSFDSFFLNYPTSINIDSIYRLPSGLSLDNSSLSRLTGIPTETGIFDVKIQQSYLLNNGYSYSQNSYIQVIIYTGNLYDKDISSVYSAFENVGIPLVDAVIQSGNFYENMYNGFISDDMIELSGYGPQVMMPANNTSGIGTIDNPTGLFNLISYETGVLSGIVPALQESYTWNNFSVIGVGRTGHVFYDYASGETESYNYAIIDQSKLVNNDSIIINDIIFTYKENQAEADENIFWFNTLDELMLYAAPIALVTGYYDGNKLHLYSIIEGDEANWFTLRRDCVDLSAVIIPNIYFTGGKYLRPSTTTWSGDFFSGFFEELTVINSGFYGFTGQIPNDYFLSGSGIVWDADILKTMTVNTGIYTQTGFGEFTGYQNMNYDSSQYLFSGSAVIPSGQEASYTGLGVRINRDLYNILDTGVAYYEVTGKDTNYSGYILI